MDLTMPRTCLPRINIEADSSNHLSLGKVRTVWASARCRLCHKMEFHCRNCKHRCHKKCPGHTHQCVRKTTRRSTGSKIYTGDEHWTKVLQANEAPTGVEPVSCPYHSRSRRRDSLASSSDRPSSVDGTTPCPAMTTTMAPSSSSVIRSPHSRQSKDQSTASSSSSSVSSSSSSVKDRTFFHSIYSRFCQWIDSTRKDSGCPTSATNGSSLHHRQMHSTSPCRVSRRSSLDSDPIGKTPVTTATTGDDVAVAMAAMGDDVAVAMAAMLTERAASVNGDPGVSGGSRALSSSDSEMGSAEASYSSTCSSLTVTSTSTTTSDCCPSCGAGGGGGALSDCSNLDDGFLSDDVHAAVSWSSVCGSCSRRGVPGGDYDGRRQRGQGQGQEEQFLPVGDGSDVTRLGWPRISDDSDSWYTGSLDKDDGDDRDCFDGNQIGFYEEYIRDSLVDWNIPLSDIEVADCLRRGVKHDVYRCRWHGDVFMYRFHHSSESDVERFLREVTRLSKIRHENICLFMGACLQPPNLAIITSELKGISVYEKLHLSSDRIPMRSRVNIGRQVAQAMGYLHAKGIKAQVLNSRNIYLEPKVKLSLLDQGMADRSNIRLNEFCIPRGSLTYLAPEMLRDFRIGCGVLSSFDTYLTTVHTDVFAFGTLLYELFTGQFPFRGLRIDEIIYQVCSGRTQALVSISCNTVLKVLIERCWSTNPMERPPFSDINQELLQKTGLHKRHSSSQPERLDRQNSFSDKCLL